MGKVNISASIDESVNEALISFCKTVVGGREYRLSKSDVVNESLKEYIRKNGGVVE